jgi:5-formyltetrahydrofolate cyclo-ligase
VHALRFRMAANPAHFAPTLTGTALHEAKRAMREQVIGLRDAIAPAVHAAASQEIARRLCALPSFADARCPLLTLPFRSEWDTHPLFAIALAEGKTVALPRVNGATRMLDLYEVRDLARDTAPGYRGIREPDPSLPRVDIRAVDWVLVPGVGFDAAGRRLGYGGGFYDRLLALMPPGTPRVAGAFDVQLVPVVPAAPHDLLVDTLATESQLLAIARARPAAPR